MQTAVPISFLPCSLYASIQISATGNNQQIGSGQQNWLPMVFSFLGTPLMRSSTILAPPVKCAFRALSVMFCHLRFVNTVYHCPLHLQSMVRLAWPFSYPILCWCLKPHSMLVHLSLTPFYVGAPFHLQRMAITCWNGDVDPRRLQPLIQNSIPGFWKSEVNPESGNYDLVGLWWLRSCC